MNVSDYDYQLPEELIAQEPAARRSDSRMLVLNRSTGACRIRPFADFPDFLRPEDCLVLNNTRVLRARLFGRRDPTGGKVEALLLEPITETRWHCMLRPGRRLDEGARVALGEDGTDGFTVVARRKDGSFEIEFEGGNVDELLEKHGHVPLPPYIRRPDRGADFDRYQTVYAQRPGAVAAPTAGLHFTREILDRIRAGGTDVAMVTLHVGAGTFQPVQVQRVEDHVMHEETFELDAPAAERINAAHRRGGRVIAVGTTTVRVLESCVSQEGLAVYPKRGRTRLFLHPPATPQVVDALLTNFHLPRSTLLMLVSTFSSREHVLSAYRLAVRERMRFYSYGDCMFLV